MNIGYKVTQLHTSLKSHVTFFALHYVRIYENIFADEIFISETLPKYMHGV